MCKTNFVRLCYSIYGIPSTFGFRGRRYTNKDWRTETERHRDIRTDTHTQIKAEGERERERNNTRLKGKDRERYTNKEWRGGREREAGAARVDPHLSKI